MSTTRPFAADDRGPDVGAAAQDGAAEAAEPEPVRRLQLSGESGIVPRARDFTRQALRDWGWLPAATADRRAAAEDVLLRRSPKSLRLEVVDSGTGEPAPRTPHQAGRPGGHGMFIVQRLCLDWGVIRTGDQPGKTVWAELAAPS
jgi:hypothetical protein